MGVFGFRSSDLGPNDLGPNITALEATTLASDGRANGLIGNICGIGLWRFPLSHDRFPLSHDGLSLTSARPRRIGGLHAAPIRRRWMLMSWNSGSVRRNRCLSSNESVPKYRVKGHVMRADMFTCAAFTPSSRVTIC